MHVTCDPYFTTCVFYLLFTHKTSFFLSQRNLSFLHTMVVTRREKLFVLCTLRPPLPNWGLTRPPNMPKVSPVAHDDGLCTEDAPTGSPQIGAPPTPLRWFWRGDDVAASSAAGASVAAARDARGKRKQLTLASAKKLQPFSFFVAKLEGERNRPKIK